MPLAYAVGMAAALGSIVGSFLNVVIYRAPRGESILRPRSRCPACGDPIPAWANIPILSWLVLRGHCRHCGAAISLRYPLVECRTSSSNPPSIRPSAGRISP